MDILYQILFGLVGQLVVGAAIWGGIRADLRGVHAHIEALHAADSESRLRMDRHLETGGLHMRLPD